MKKNNLIILLFKGRKKLNKTVKKPKINNPDIKLFVDKISIFLGL